MKKKGKENTVLFHPSSLIPHPYFSGLLLLLLLAGCQRAARYPEVKKERPEPSADETARRRLPPEDLWLEPRPSLDIPLRFVSASTHPDEWKALREFWTHEGAGVGGQRTAHLGLSPLGAVVALRLSAAHEVIKIKVPLGLPDPTPNVPAANPPTHGPWRLGKKLFFDRELLKGPDLLRTYGCASCHRPAEGFTEPRPVTPDGLMNTSSLLNCVYNRHQFWDGRAATLEEAIQQTLEDEAPPRVSAKVEDSPEARHAWAGAVARLNASAPYRQEFARVFGTAPTLDNAAKALATYLRTLLAGGSVYDRAEGARAERKGAALSAADFRAALDDTTLPAIAGPSLTGQRAAAALLEGHDLFHGKARCAVCHPGPLFTDHDFHNVGVRESVSLTNRVPGLQRGRFARLPPGLKDRRSIGAFKTPTLRALPRTGPYMHDGGLRSLGAVVRYFNFGVRGDDNEFLDPELRHGRYTAWRPGLNAEELNALEMFLKALDGEPTPPRVAGP